MRLSDTLLTLLLSGKTHPTPPSPTSAIRELFCSATLCVTRSRIPLSTKSGSRRHGTVDKGFGEGSVGSGKRKIVKGFVLLLKVVLTCG